MQRRDFMKSSAQAALLSLAARPLLASSLADAAPAHDRMQWWREARFGMFVHFGLYSMLAGEWNGRTDYGEWIRNNAQIPIDQYDQLLARFNPTAFDADKLAAMAAAAGMKYLVITTKHHDGFALWPSKQGAFNVAHTLYRRDLMREVSRACRRHGVVPCWYHSIMDWHHADYLPRREWEAAGRPSDGAVFSRYVSYLHAQVEELLTHYGEIGVMWFDGEWEPTWTPELGAALLDHVRRLAPNTLVNSRVAKQPANGLEATLSRPALGDFGTPEQKVPERGLKGVDWESCITMNGNWGYNRADKNFKSVGELVGILTDTASKGGNLLLNVGPMGDGAVPAESIDRLQGMARWMKVHGDAIHGTTASPFEGLPFKVTTGARRLNCFLPTWPQGREVVLPALMTLPRARMLGDPARTPLAARRGDRGVVVTLPEMPSDPVCSVLTLEFDGTPTIAAP